MARKEEGGTLSPLVGDSGEIWKVRDTNANDVDSPMKMLTLVGNSLEDV